MDNPFINSYYAFERFGLKMEKVATTSLSACLAHQQTGLTDNL
jgi:hypothetical protein